MAKPLPAVSVHFLGTCSGGGPIVSRNCSSLAVDFGNDIWLFDAADGTLGRLHQSPLRLSNISRVFITHMHADHVLGLVTILTTIMSGIGMNKESLAALEAKGVDKKADVNIYGPKGLRKLVRTSLELTAVTLAGAYAVHEISPGGESSATCNAEDLHPNEAVGRDIAADADGVWRAVLSEGNGKQKKGWAVSAGPIKHRGGCSLMTLLTAVPSLGYVLQEPTPRLPLDTAALIPLLKSNAEDLRQLENPINHPLSLLSHLTSLPSPEPFQLPSGETLHPPLPSGVAPRKLVIFGDCSGGTENAVFEAMCQDPSLLVHECTNAGIPELIQQGEKGRKVRMAGMDAGLVERSENQTGKKVGVEGKAEGDRAEREAHKVEETQRKAQSRGHSTPVEVASFVKVVKARRVVLNHFSAMFPSPRYPSADPIPSLLSPVCPYPFPTPYPPYRSAEPPPAPMPLTGAELHLRLIMDSIARQVSTNISHTALVSTARDYMIVRVPAHELSESEEQGLSEYQKESERVRLEWEARGGLYVDNEWVGVEEAA